MYIGTRRFTPSVGRQHRYRYARIQNDYQSIEIRRCVLTLLIFVYLLNHFTVFILILFFKISKFTQLELIELLDGNISELRDFESNSDGMID